MKLFDQTRPPITLFAGVTVFLGALVISPPKTDADALQTDGLFVKRTLASAMHLFDLGVTDINDDGWLDIYTNNHAARSLILLNRQDGTFTDETLHLNLGNSKEYVGSEPSLNDRRPKIDRPGLYIYWELGDLVVHAHRISESEPVSGTILVRNGEIAESEGSVVVTERAADDAIKSTFPREFVTDTEKAILFMATKDATIRIKSFLGYYAPGFKIDKNFSLGGVLLGALRENPVSHTFILDSVDRHSMAWFDIDGNASIDVVTGAGGRGGRLRGRVEEGSRSFRVLLQRAGRFEEAFPYRELSSYGCPTRQLSLADYDADGDLDIYVNCGRTLQDTDLLFEQGNDTFEEVSAARGLTSKGNGKASWLDADGDGDLDLFRTARREAWLYRNDSGLFEGKIIGTLRGEARQISTTDYDGDGDSDIYLAARNGSSLLIGGRGGFEIIEPERIGLPRYAECGNWVDYNNDGIQDLHVLPGGVFEQRADKKFYPTGVLGTAELLGFPVCIWFDSNNDGYRDLLIAVPEKPTLLERLRTRIAQRIGEDKQVWISQNPYLYFLQGVTMGHPFFRPEIWDLTLYRALRADRHWLEVRLAGARGNQPAIGTSVRVRTASAAQVQTVGHAEGSLRSSGHYRVYFGLGDEASIDSVQVAWPDGSLQKIDRVASDRLLTIQQGGKD